MKKRRSGYLTMLYVYFRIVQDPTRSCIHYHALAGSLVYGKYMYENEYLRIDAYVAKKTCTKILKDCL